MNSARRSPPAKGGQQLLLTHTHWDHIQGFPFFAPIFVPGNVFEVYGHADSPERLEGILDGQMNPNFSPIHTLKNLGAQVRFSTATNGEPFSVDGVSISAVKAPHGNTTVLAFRLDDGDAKIVYATDLGYPDSGPLPELVEFFRGADVLIHDTTYTPEDQAPRRGRGMSSYAEAARAAVLSEVDRLVMFHYDQDYTDDFVDGIVQRCRDEVKALGGAPRWWRREKDSSCWSSRRRRLATGPSDLTFSGCYRAPSPAFSSPPKALGRC